MLLSPAPLIRFQVLNRYTPTGNFDRQVQVESISQTLAFLTDYAAVFVQPRPSGEISAYRVQQPGPTYRVREVPQLTSTQRRRLEAAVWQHTPSDFRGVLGRQRYVMGHAGEMAGTHPLSAYTALQLLDRLPARVQADFAGYYVR